MRFSDCLSFGCIVKWWLYVCKVKTYSVFLIEPNGRSHKFLVSSTIFPKSYVLGLARGFCRIGQYMIVKIYRFGTCVYHCRVTSNKFNSFGYSVYYDNYS